MPPAARLDLPAPPDSTSTPDQHARILAQAKVHLLTYGYSAFTMDDLATELGMSKKTLYLHFRSKQAMVRAVIDGFGAEVRAEADALFADRRLTFAEKLRSFAEGMIERLSHLNPKLLRDLQRFAPELHRHIEQMRSRNIPYIFGRLIEEGQRSGMVRTDVSPVFAAEFHLHAMQGMMNPETLRRLHQTPNAAFESAIRLLFSGLLTSAGQKQHEKLFPR
jgi:AcrR family transcriptional regulator